MARTSALPRLSALVAALAITISSNVALAAGYDDAAASKAVDAAMNEDYASANYSEANRKFQDVLDKCAKRGSKCSSSTRANALIGQGMVAPQLGKVDDAKAFFGKALQEDPNAKLPSSGTSPNIRAQFADAQKAQPAPAPAPTPVDTTAAGDSFNAAYLAARLQGAEPAAAVGAAHDLAAQVIQHRGAIMPRAAAVH